MLTILVKNSLQVSDRSEGRSLIKSRGKSFCEYFWAKGQEMSRVNCNYGEVLDNVLEKSSA